MIIKENQMEIEVEKKESKGKKEIKIDKEEMK